MLDWNKMERRLDGLDRLDRSFTYFLYMGTEWGLLSNLSTCLVFLKSSNKSHSLELNQGLFYESRSHQQVLEDLSPITSFLTTGRARQCFSVSCRAMKPCSREILC